MLKQIGMSEARQAWFKLEEFCNGEPFAIVRHGKPVLVAMRPQVFDGLQATLGIYREPNLRERMKVPVEGVSAAGAVGLVEARKRAGLPADGGGYHLRAFEEAVSTLERMKDEHLRRAIVQALAGIGERKDDWLPLTYEFAGFSGCMLPNRYLAVFTTDADRNLLVIGIGQVHPAVAQGLS